MTAEEASMRRSLSGLGFALVLMLTSGCGRDSPSSAKVSGHVVSVVTTTTQLTDFAKRIGGERVSVYGVLKANVDPHDYEPSPADLDAVARADVLVKNGVGLDQWFDKVIASAGPKAPVLDASQGVTIRHGQGDEEAAGDPHIWHDPRNAIIMAATLERGLELADAADAALFQKNLADFTTELHQLDAEIKAEIDPLTNKKLVTNHDAFGYYIDRYGLEYVGSIIPSFDTQADLSARDVSAVVAKIKATGTKAVFSETSLPPKTAEAIGRDAGVRVVAGDDALYGDTLGPEGSDGATYIQMERHNTRVIVDNLK